MITFSLSRTDYIFSTAHKSKGLEFDTVKMVDDFLMGDFGESHAHHHWCSMLSFACKMQAECPH